MIDALTQEFSSNGTMDLPIILLRLLGAALLCGLIGFERELSNTTAGLRTNMLVGLAAAGFALITLQTIGGIGEDYEDFLRVDPIRLVEAVTAGVAFLAAGIIVFTRGKVTGLTSGAGMWLSGAIGLATGLGYWSISLPSAAIGLLILYVMRRIELATGIKEKEPRDQDG